MVTEQDIARVLTRAPADVVHELLLERRRLVAEGVEEKYQWLKQVESLLKDAIDANGGGPVVDEELGVRLSYKHQQEAQYDAVKLAHLVPAEWLGRVLETRINRTALYELINSGRLTPQELRESITGYKPRRGPLQEIPLKGANQ